MATDKIKPLPVDTTGKLVPFNASDPSGQPTGVSASADRESSDPVDAWMTDNATFNDAAPDPTAQARETREALDKDLGVAPETEATPDAPSEAKPDEAAVKAAADTKPVAQAKPDDEAKPAAEAKTPAAEAKPEAPAPKSFAPDEKIGLAEGTEWTRAQITTRLQEYVAQQPLVQEAAGFKQLFGADFETTKREWGPILSRLASEPSTTLFLDEFLSNPRLSTYLEECRLSWYEQTGQQARVADVAQPAAQPQPQTRNVPVDSAMAREVAELRNWRMEQEKRETTDRVNREVATATAKYPMLASDRALLSDLMLTAQYMNAQDPSKGILDALAAKASIYDALAMARSAPPLESTPVAAPQPALLGTNGASPNGSRQAAAPRPKQFDNLDDAVDDWATNAPKL